MGTSQVIFVLTLLITIGIFSFSIYRLYILFKLTKKHTIKNFGKRFLLVLKIALGQTKILRFPFAGILHAIVFWGFIVILFGSIEMVIDGITGYHKSLSFFGKLYNIIMGFGDVFAFLITIAVIIFIVRRISYAVIRFEGYEMKTKAHIDALLALILILILMISLLGMNYTESIYSNKVYYPVSNKVAMLFPIEKPIKHNCGILFFGGYILN